MLLRFILISLAAWLTACSGSEAKDAHCKNHADCADGLQCKGGICQRVACGPLAGACPDGTHCCGGLCSSSACCVADFECPEGFCEGGACREGTRPGCSESEPCQSGRCLQTLGECVECVFSDDCSSADLVCSPTHECIPLTEGCTPATCAEQGLVCGTDGECRQCVSTAECGDQICEGGTCQLCTTGDSCGIGRVCEDGVCRNDRDVSCTSNADCGDRWCNTQLNVCENCLVPADCGSGMRCVDGHCIAENAECTRDADCEPPVSICVFGACEAGCSAGSCADGQVCSPTTGRCVVTSTGTIALGESCASHSTCQSGVCWPLLSSENEVVMRCSRSCVRHDDCPPELLCLEVGDANLCWPNEFNQDPFSVPPGSACSGSFENGSCMTGYCDTEAGACMQMCGREADCADVGGGAACVSRWPLGDDENGDGFMDSSEIRGFTQLCHAPFGSLDAGEECTDPERLVPDHEACRSGYCAQTPDYSLPPRCAKPCCGPLDCGTSRNVCKPLHVWDGIRYDFDDDEPYAFQKICLHREYDGAKVIGESCSHDSECRSEICVAGPNGGKRCTHTCCTNRDCADYDWSTGCRPPFFGDHLVADENFAEVIDSLGRVAYTMQGVFKARAVSPVCMPR